jgi:hypothetical protein
MLPLSRFDLRKFFIRSAKIKSSGEISIINLSCR